MERISECLMKKGSFFKTLSLHHSDIYEELFAGLTNKNPDQLDDDLIITCSDRYAAPLLLVYDIKKVTDYILNRYLDSWRRIKAALMADYDVLSPINQSKVTVRDKATDNTTTGTTREVQSVNTFDTIEPVEKQEEGTTNQGTMQGSELTRTTVDTTGSKELASVLIEKEIRLRKHDFLSIVIKDIKNQLTLDVY